MQNFFLIFTHETLFLPQPERIFSINQTLHIKIMKRAEANSPDWRRRGQNFVEALLAQQPVGVHLALSLDLDGPSWLDDVAAGLLQSIARQLRHVNAP